MKYFYLILIFTISGCAANKMIRFPVEYEVVDNPEERRIELHYVNNHEKTVCLSLDTWPNSSGAIGFASEFVILKVNGKRFPIKDLNTGYCPGCMKKVKPGEEVIGFIPYEFFNLPESLINETKELELISSGTFCETSNN